ncbi:hypothetical protein [Longimicrobium sp.]|uniref:hypothetical protein n=1 Tax=Longimicrobium sp. TaxID=2029185 RepID=UPI002E340573|nr:hypothetical protein [Longimicrobium sp.]HEX6036517.1 hypothetical protein [Longimicrobium sp.]
MTMMWAWIERLFLRAGSRPEPARAPEGAPPRTRDERDALLLESLDGLGGPGRGAAAIRLQELVFALPMAHRVRVDDMLRQRVVVHDGYHGLPWLRGADDVRRLALPADTEAAVFGLLAGAASGYVREAAVQRLADVRTGGELAPLLLRANDWVAPVRRRAQDALRARVVPAYAPHWICAMRLVLRLRETGRGDNGPLVDSVMDLLRGDDVRAAVLEGLYTPDRVGARACYTILLRSGAPDLQDIVFRALGSDDVVVRLEAARAAARLDDGALAELLPWMMADPFLRVRMTAMELAERRGLAGLPELGRALLDRSPAGRAHARAVVTRAGPMDFAAFYRNEIRADSPRLAEAIAGLAETGRAEDAEVIRPALAHTRPRVRVAAIRALARLAGDRHLDAFLLSLGSLTPRVSRAAADALRDRTRLVDEAAIASAFAAESPLHARENALELLAWRGKWDGLVWILQALTDSDPRIREAAGTLLERWRQRFNRTFAQPTSAQLERVRTALQPVASTLPPETVKWLRFAAGIGG